MYTSIVLHPGEKAAPGGIIDRFGEVPVLHHVSYLQVFVGNEITRCH
jgi:hypothetical protein